MRRLLRAAAIAPLLTVGITVGVASAVTSAPGRPVCADAAWTHHASLVVEHGDGRVIRVCVGFDGNALTGDQLLAASGVEYATSGSASMGKAVCQIDSEPASYPPTCWTTTSRYWIVFVSRHGGPWSFSNLGVSSQTFADGDAEGVRYDAQAGPAAAPPSPAGTCVLAAPTPAPAHPGVTPAPRRATSSASAEPAPSAGTPAAATASPGPGVVNTSTSGPTSHPAAPAGFSVAPVVAAAAGGGLIGLLLLRALRLRRR